ncbi:hypothetical protein Bca101_071797 [Brassica carinata]
MKHIAKDPNARERVDFNDMGEPVGPGSVKLSSYLGPLVREHVTVTVEDWRKVSEEVKTVLWKSIQARFELDEDYQKSVVLRQMGCLWRASKSRLVTQIKSKATNQERMNLRPKNVNHVEWRKFVKCKTSSAFKERRSKQIPHTCSRRGTVRLAEDMKKECGDPSTVNRLKVWVKSRTKKDGTPVNTVAAEKFSVNKRAQPKCVLVDWSGSDENVAEGRIISYESEDFVNDIPLGPLAVKLLVETAIKSDAFLWRPATGMFFVEHAVGEMIAWPASKCVMSNEGIFTEDIPLRSPNSTSLNKCKLLSPWSTDEEIVAEGRWQCQEPKALVDNLPLGPNAVKVFVDVVHVPDIFLWRPSPEMTYLRDSVKQFVAWPADKCVFENNTESPSRRSPLQNEDSSSSKSSNHSPKSNLNKAQTPSPLRRSQVHF